MNRWILLAVLATSATSACRAPATVLRRDLDPPPSSRRAHPWVESVTYGPRETRVVVQTGQAMEPKRPWYPTRSFLLVEELAYPPRSWSPAGAHLEPQSRLTLVFALDRRLLTPAHLVLAHAGGEITLEIPAAPGAAGGAASAPDQSGTGP